MVVGVCGRPGSGKTLYMSSFGHRALRRRRVVANYHLQGAGYVGSPAGLFELRDALVLLDEVHAWAASRDWQKNSQMLLFFAQHRKLGLDIVWSAQDSHRVDKALVEVTDSIYDVRRFRLLEWEHPLSRLLLIHVSDPRDTRSAKHQFVLSQYRVVWLPATVGKLYDTRETVGSVHALWDGVSRGTRPSVTVSDVVGLDVLGKGGRVAVQAPGRVVTTLLRGGERVEVSEVVLLCSLCNGALGSSAYAVGGRLFCSEACAKVSLAVEELGPSAYSKLPEK